MNNVSRVIGMEVPGRNSLFSNLNIIYRKILNHKNNCYKVQNVVSEVKLIETNYAYKFYKITTNSFLYTIKYLEYSIFKKILHYARD